MPWLLLFFAGLLEIGWAVGLRYSEGFTKPLASVLTAGALIASFVLLGIAMRSLPVGTAYGVWVGIGAVGTAILDTLLFGQPSSLMKIISVGLIVAGVIGLKLASS